MHDDWSYIFTAQEFARTGHFVYNGWSTAMLGWMIPWGALFAKLFGISFTAVRASMIPIASGCAVLFHTVLRRFGLNPALATFGTLALCLLPPFFPLSDIFMSDVPGLFAILLCIYLCQRAVDSDGDRTALLWLVAAGLADLFFGTARQTGWFGVLVIVPSCGWLLRRRRYAVIVTIALWLVGVAVIVGCIHWFLSHPYSVPEKLPYGLPTQTSVAVAFDRFFRSGLTLLIFCLPLLCSGIAFIPRLRSRARLTVALGMLAFFVLVLALKFSGHWNAWRPFWEGDLVGAAGVLQLGYGYGVPIPTLSSKPLDALSVIVAVASISFAVLLWQERGTLCRPAALGRDSGRQNALVLLLPFLLIYCAAIAPRAATPGGINDRYMLPILVVVWYLLLRAYQDHVASRAPWLAYGVLVALALATLANTHDRFATSRASAQLLERLQASGAKRTEIAAGWEYDGWTQIETTGYVNEPKLINPPGAYIPFQRPYNIYDPCAINFLPMTPSIYPKYAITQGVSPCFNPHPVMTMSYHTWLPPWTRTLYIQAVAQTQ